MAKMGKICENILWHALQVGSACLGTQLDTTGSLESWALLLHKHGPSTLAVVLGSRCLAIDQYHVMCDSKGALIANVKLHCH